MNRILTIIWLQLACLMPTLCIAQDQGLDKNFEIGFGIGAFNYKGDLAPYMKYQNTRIGGNIHGRFNFNSALSLRVGLTLGQIGAADRFQNDIYYQQRDFSFSGFIFEANSLLEYHFFDLRKDKKVNRFSPYVFGGLGAASISARTENVTPENSNHAITPVLPFGAGIKYALNAHVTLSLELSTSKTFSDRTDAVIDTPNQEIAPAERERLEQVSYTNGDTYYYLGFSISYRFIRVNCPEHYDKIFK